MGIEHAAKLREYVPQGAGYNSEFANDLAAAADEIDRLINEVAGLMRGECICKRCGLRKDAETPEGDF
jgi:hypothetical protein